MGYPTSGTYGSALTHAMLVGAGHTTRNFVNDQPKIDVWNGSWGVTDISAADSVGTADQVEVNSSLQLGIDFDNAETFGFNFAIPEDADVAKDMDLRFYWSNSAAVAAAETALFTPLYKHLIPGTTAIAVPATAFSTVAAAQASFGANVGGYTGWNTITGGVLTSAYVIGESRLAIKITCTLTTLTDAKITSAQFRYFRKMI